MGYVRAGIIGYFFPSSVIHGMLAGIGILIFLKQIPHAFGYDEDAVGDMEFNQIDGHNTFTELYYMMDYINMGALIVTLISLFILIGWSSKFMQKFAFTNIIPGPLVAVATGILLNKIFIGNPQLELGAKHLVSIPVPTSAADFLGNFTLPDIAGLLNPDVYVTAVVIAIVASLETLLSLEATDKLDSQKRVSPANKELKAQGIGNIISGLIGGLPVTQVIVRSSANIQSKATGKASAIMHGIWLLLSIILIPRLLNQIPLATLAAILLVIGFKLAKPALFKTMYKQGMGHFLPFIVTIVGMVFTDLLKGIGLGMAVAIFIILRNNLRVSHYSFKGSNNGVSTFVLKLSENVTFLNKAAIRKALSEIPENTEVIIDASQNQFLDFDVKEIISNFEVNAKTKGIKVTIKNLGKNVVHEPMTNFEIIQKK